MTVCFDLNPQIKRLLDDAIKASKPVWLGYLNGDKEPHTRLAIYLVPNDDGSFSNDNYVQTDPAPHKQHFDGACLAEKATGPWFIKAPLVRARDLDVGDRLASLPGDIVFIP